MSTLSEKLLEALRSRQGRNILRRLPPPSSSNPSHSEGRVLVDFVSNDYLSLTAYEPLRRHFLQNLNEAPDVLGSGGSRLLVNGSVHQALEDRIAIFFDTPAALLFNSGFDANVGFFTCIPQEGDVVIFDEYIHASVHDGIRASRARQSSYAFAHGDVSDLRKLLKRLLEERHTLRNGTSSAFVAVEGLYSMDGTFAPLTEIVEVVEELFPLKNAHIVVDEAHTTGIYGRDGRGLVSHLGLEDRIFARLHTFGKALASSGAIFLTTPLVKEYLVNYARSLIFTTSLSCANVIAIGCSFDLMEDGTTAKLAEELSELIRYTIKLFKHRLQNIPSTLVYLPTHISLESSLLTPIIPVMTPFPRPLSSHLQNLGLNARPITWPTVPKGKDRVRVCLHAGNTREDVQRLVEGINSWAVQFISQNRSRGGQQSLENVEAKL